MTKKAINTLLRYKRIFHRNTPVYINPDEPDWFIPTARAEVILKSLLKGNSVFQAAERDSSDHRVTIEQSLFLINRLIGRLEKKGPAEYTGRSDVLSLGKLKECWFHITNNCNLSCGHCMFSSRPGSIEELSRGQLLSGIEQAGQLGCKIFYFTGGEPFVYEGFTDICDHIFEKEESHVVILSNGILLNKFSKWLEGTDKDRIHFQISLDGLRKSHDAIRGRGAFAKTIGNVRLLKNIGCNVSLAMAVTRGNVCDMAAMVELAASLDVSNIHFLWLFKKGQEKGNDVASAEDICEQLSKAKKVADANGVLIDNIEIIKSQIFSLAGTKYDLSNSCWQSLAIGPGGGIYPSPALIGEERLKAGDISEGIERLWRDSQVCNMVRKASLIDSKGYSENPLKFLIGGGDIDHSYIHSGQLAGADPYVEIYNNIALEVLTEQVDMRDYSERIAFLSRMGEQLYGCGEDMGEVVCTHSNCVLSLPGKDGHTLVQNFYSDCDSMFVLDKQKKECIHDGCPLWSCEKDDKSALSTRVKLSIVVPVFNEYDQINAAIANLRKIGARGDSCEIIIVDGDPQRSTIKVIEDDGVRAIVSAKGRGAQMNAGAKIANGEAVLFLHADTKLPEGAMEKIGAVLEDKKYVGGAFNLGIDSDRLFLRWIAAGANRRSRLSRVPYGDQAIFIRKEYFNEIGQFKDVPLMEDVDLMRRIKKRGDEIFILPEKVATSARRWETEGAIYTTIRNQILVNLYYLGVGPRRLARFYRICSNGLVKKKKKVDTKKKCVLLFVKYPARGKVKTRLAEQIGEEAALGLYKNFVVDILATLKGLDVELKIVFDPAENEDMFQRWLGKEYSYIAQVGQDLGERIKNAFLQAYGEGFDSVVVIGSDSPDLSAEYLELAFEGLCGDDAVIGPSSDGGYYVIGFAKNSFLPEAFDGIGWSSDEVFKQTSDILRGHGIKYGLLPEWHDVDTLADMKSFVQRNEKSAFSDSATMRYFAEHKDIE